MNISAKNLTKHYDDASRKVEVFNDLRLEVGSGKSLAIIGESGVGKTTLLMMLGLLEVPTSGQIELGERVITSGDELGGELAAFRGKHVGLVFQSHHLFPEFSALENVAMPLLIQGVDREEAESRARLLLARVRLSDRLEHLPGQLSGGEQQRVAIARALANSPGVLLADEPTGDLDRKTGREITKLLLEMQSEEGVTLVVVTHSYELAKLMDGIVELTPKSLVALSKESLPS